MEFRDFGHTTMIPICNWIFWNFFGGREIQRTFQQGVTRLRFWHPLQKLWCFVFFLSNEAMLLATAIAAESTQNYQILSKSAQRQTWELWNTTKNWDFIFFAKKNPLCRRRTKACAHCLDFQHNNFLYAILIVKKRPLYVNFSIPPCGK
jgi:hypothetical protein